MSPPLNEPSLLRRLLTLGVMLGTTMAVVLIGAWQLLPLMAPQFVIKHSPWIWPIIQAEAFETEGKEPQPLMVSNPTPGNESELTWTDVMLRSTFWTVARS